MCVDWPWVHAVWVCSHLSVRVLRQRLHDCCRFADPHFSAQVHLRHPRATLQWSVGSYSCKWLFYVVIRFLQRDLLWWCSFNSLSQTLVDIIRGLPDTNIASLVFAVVGSVVLIVVKELSARYRHKLPFPIPVEIIVVSSLEFLQSS